jgi:Ca2+/H+ antiporter
MKPLLEEVQHNPLLWLLALVPVVLAAQARIPESHTLLFVLSVAAIIPLAALLSRATESVAARVLVFSSFVIGPMPMDLQFWRGTVVMMLIASITASLVTNSGRSAWFIGALIVTVYVIFGMTLYLLPPRI